MITRYSDNHYVIQEGSSDLYGRLRFALDQRIGERLDNLGWFPTMSHAQTARLTHRNQRLSAQ